MKLKFALVNLSLALTLFSIALPANEIENVQLPDMGDSTGRLISPAQEKELGKAFFRQLHAKLEISEDMEIQQYIQETGHKLVQNSDAPQNPFYFFVVLDSAINAFAGPGGYIGINSGLILMTEAESELTSVMAHEVAHITQRHLYRAFEAASQLSLPTAAATLAAILIGTQNPQAGQAALMAIQAGNIQKQIDFTRENEKEADSIGMKTLVAAGYDPHSMPTFFERLQQSSRFYGQAIPEFLRTHPVTMSRISDSRGRADQFPYKQYPDSLTYLLVKTKLRALTGRDQNDSLRYFQSIQQQGTPEQRAVGRYGEALVYLQSQQFNAAEQILKNLIAAYSEQPFYVGALARCYAEAKQYEKAAKVYQQAIKQFPTNQALKIDYTSTLLKAGQPKQAQQVLKTLPTDFQEHSLYLELLAQSYADLKQMAESHRYLAEYYYAIGQTETAILQTRLALQEKSADDYLKAILEERLRFFMEEEKQRRKMIKLCR
jgi:beta-barrel assembly-enhancing protease